MNLAALRKADAVIAVCDGPQVDDGTAWEVGYAYGRNIQTFGIRTDVRIVQRSDEQINLMVLESLSEMSPTIEQLIHTLRYADRPKRRGRREVPLINVMFQHGRTLEEASRGLEAAVDQVSKQFQSLVRRVEWASDRKRVKLDGVGFWVEMWIDAQAVHAIGDIPTLRLLGGSLSSGLKQILQQTFQKKLR